MKLSHFFQLDSIDPGYYINENMKAIPLQQFLVGVLAALMTATGAQAASSTWDAGGGGNTTWSEPTNWVGDSVPTFVATDTFDLTLTAGGTSTMSFNATLGIMNIGSTDGTVAWTLNRSGSEALTLDNGASASQINTTLSSDAATPANTISVPIAIKGDLNIDNLARGKQLVFNNQVSSSATSGSQTITLTGNGGYGNRIEFSGGITDGTSGGKVAVHVNQPSVGGLMVFNTSINANTYTGGTTLSGGRIVINSSNAFGADGSSLTIDGPIMLQSPSTQNLGTLNISSNFDMVGASYGTLTLTGSTQVNLGNATRTITGLGGGANLGYPDLNFMGSGQTINDGTFKIMGGGGTTATTPMSVGFYAVTTFNNADLLIGANAATIFGVANAFGTTSGSLPGVTVEANGALNLSTTALAGATSQDLTIASLAGAGNVVNSAGVAGTATLTINGTATTTFSGTIKDGGYNGQTAGLVALTKTGSGTQTLSGTNTYTGATTVSVGTLIINGNQSSATGAVSVSAGATLGGNGTVGGVTTINGILAPGNSIGQLNVTANTTWAGAASAGATTDWKFELGAGNTADLLNITGDFLKDTAAGTKFEFNFLASTATGTFKLVDWTGSTGFSSGDFTWNNLGAGNTVSSFNVDGATTALYVTVVPEPATWALLAFSLTTVMVLRRRRRS